MILQCMKCDLYFRSFSRIKYHKALQCAGEIREENVPKEDVNLGDDNPWSYNLEPLKSVLKEDNETKPELSSELSKPSSGDGSEAIKEELKEESKEVIKKEILDNLNDVTKAEVNNGTEIKDVKPDVKEEIGIKKEYVENMDDNDPDNPDTLKTEKEEIDNSIKEVKPIKKDPYADGVYHPAPILVDSDSEYEAESDDSAPEDDDIETHLGMLTKWNPHKKDQPRVRKRKREIPADAKVVFMVTASGQQVKKIKLTNKESQRWVPPHPWVPYPHQVTVEQCCMYLELKDYPIVVNEELKEKFKDKKVFDDYALPLLKTANPNAHPLTLSTLIRAKWFEVMNTETPGAKRENEANEMAVDGTNEENDSKPVTYSRQSAKTTNNTITNIRLNFN